MVKRRYLNQRLTWHYPRRFCQIQSYWIQNYQLQS